MDYYSPIVTASAGAWLQTSRLVRSVPTKASYDKVRIQLNSGGDAVAVNREYR